MLYKIRIVTHGPVSRYVARLQDMGFLFRAVLDPQVDYSRSTGNSTQYIVLGDDPRLRKGMCERLEGLEFVVSVETNE